MGEAQGRGSMSGIAACDVCFTPLTRLGSRLRFVPSHPPLGNKGGLILVPRHPARSFNALRARSESNMPSLIALGKVAMCRARQREHEPDEWSEAAIIRSELQVCRRASRADGRSGERSARARVIVRNSGLRCMLHSTHPVRRSRFQRFTTDIPPVGKKGGLMLVPRRRRGKPYLRG